MAAANILTIGSADTNSTDVVVAAGTPLTVCLKDASGPVVAPGAFVRIQLKGDGGQYVNIDFLSSDRPALVIVGPGAYRFVRSGGVSCGVFSG